MKKQHRIVAKPKIIANKIKMAMENRHFPLCAIAFNTGLNRKRLASFLSGETSLRTSDIDKVLDFLDLDIVETKPDEKRSQNYTVNKTVYGTIADDLYKNGVAFISDGENASGTLVAIGDKEFIATAGHVIPRSLDKLNLVGMGLHSLKRDDVKVVAANRTKGRKPDVGYIELAKGSASLLGREAISIDRIHDKGPGEGGRVAFLYGTPYALMKNFVNKKRREWIFGFTAFTYTNCTLSADEWPEVSADAAKPRRTVDLFIPYDVSEEMIVNQRSGGRLPNPKGASGGGIWQGINKGNNGIWHPGHVKLIAIQSSWDEKKKYIRGVQIKHWVRLIEQDYPKLKKHFSKIKIK